MILSGYTIVYVAHIEQTIEFYEKAFGSELKFFPESKRYAVLETGNTTVAFADESYMAANVIPFVQNRQETKPAGFELAFIVKDVDKAYEQALAGGARSLRAPSITPWGQRVAYVADCNGVIVELGSQI